MKFKHKPTQVHKRTKNKFRILTDPVTGRKMRKGIRNNQLVTDIELTDLGFNGIENVIGK